MCARINDSGLGSMTHIDYERVMTSVLIPLEYCACGFTETEAFQHYGAESVLVCQAPIRNQDACFQLGNCAEFAICKALFLKPERVRNNSNCFIRHLRNA